MILSSQKLSFEVMKIRRIEFSDSLLRNKANDVVNQGRMYTMKNSSCLFTFPKEKLFFHVMEFWIRKSGEFF